MENGKLEAVTIEDEIPANLEFVQGSERAEGAGPSPVELKGENGKVIAKISRNYGYKRAKHHF